MKHLFRSISFLAIIAIIFTACGKKKSDLSAQDLIKSICEVTNSKGKTIEDVSRTSLGVSVYQCETILQFKENIHSLPSQTLELWSKAIEEELVNDPEYLNKLKPFLKELQIKASAISEEAIVKAFEESNCFALYQLLPTLVTYAEER